MKVRFTKREKEVISKMNEMLQESTGTRYHIFTEKSAYTGLCGILDSLMGSSTPENKDLRDKLYILASEYKPTKHITIGTFWFNSFEERKGFIQSVIKEYC